MFAVAAGIYVFLRWENEKIFHIVTQIMETDMNQVGKRHSLTKGSLLVTSMEIIITVR